MSNALPHSPPSGAPFTPLAMDLPASTTIGGAGAGVAPIDGLVAAAAAAAAPSPSEATTTTGATFFSSPPLDNEPTRNDPHLGSALKMAKAEPFPPPKSSSSLLHLRSNGNPLFPEGQQMLSFSQPPASSSSSSSAEQESLLLRSGGSLPYYHLSSSLPASSSSGYVGRSGGLNVSLHGVMVGAKGYFTPSQWVELEHQAMIYKCLDANVPIPPSLLLSIRKSLYPPSGYTAYSAGSLRPGTYGWGSFQLGFSGNTDPEPGRCRRTDGKKWRCTRDAVADQKYCERHLNRGRHRSRKPVEGQTGQAKAMSVIARSPASLTVSGSGSTNCSPAAPQKHLKSFQHASTEPSPSQFNRIPINRDSVDDSQNLSFAITTNPKLGDTHFLVPKQHNPFEETSQGSDFGLNCNSSLLDPSRTSFMENRSFDPSSELKHQSYPLRSFMEEWPNNQPDRMTSSWPETKDDPPDRTQLSMSIPFPSDFPSSSSPAQEKMSYSSLKLSQGFDPTHMGLGVGVVGNDIVQKQMNSAPISWEASMGGPLGEVLNNTCNNKDATKSGSSLNLATAGWDTSPPESSPTGVLQKATFCSLSSSTGSSPRLENYNSHESTGNLHDHLLGSTLFNPTTIPSL